MRAWDGYTGGYIGGLYRGTTHQLPRAETHPPDSDRRERVLSCRGRVVRKQGGATLSRVPVGVRPSHVPTPSGPGRPSPAPGRGLPGTCLSPSKRARFRVPYLKVSQNGQVSPKSVNKACHSPYSQNGSQISPLGILRFPLFLAFSHKELMGLF